MSTWGHKVSKKFDLLRRNSNQSNGNLKYNERNVDDINYRRNSKKISSFRQKQQMQREPLKNIPYDADKNIYENSTINSSDQHENLNIKTSCIPNNALKTFFHRIGSTGMLNRNQNTKQPTINKYVCLIFHLYYVRIFCQ